MLYSFNNTLTPVSCTAVSASNIYKLINNEELNYDNFKTKDAAKLNIIDCLAFYNSKRTHSKLGFQSPLQL